MKYLLIIVSISLMLLAVVLLVRMAMEQEVAVNPVVQTQYTEESNTQVISPYSTRPERASGKIIVHTESGKQIPITDITKSQSFVAVGGNMFYYQGAEQVSKKPYNIYFNANNASFAVSPVGNNLPAVTEQLGYDLLTLLNVTRDDLCELNIYVGVSYQTNPELSGSNLGLPLCNN